jgi:hypothetical protein
MPATRLTSRCRLVRLRVTTATSVHLGAVSSRYSCSTKLVEGTSHEMLSPFSVRLPGADSRELQFTFDHRGVASAKRCQSLRSAAFAIGV